MSPARRLMSWTAALLVARAIAATELTIEVRDHAGRPIRGAYVGVAREADRFDYPVAEKIGADDVIRFDLPPGTYRIVAAARGFGTDYGSPATVGAQSQRIIVNLVPLGAIAGRVIDTDGKPVEGARIGMLSEFVVDHPGRLSAAAREYLRADHLAVTDADGYFELPMLLDRSAVALIEADGMTPKVLPNVRVGSHPLNVTLSRGASLTAKGADVTSGWVQLVPLDLAADAALSRDRALALWRRPAGTATWSALPPGRFEIDFIPVTGGAAGKPVALAEVSLAGGDRKSIEVHLPPPLGSESGLRRFRLRSGDPLRLVRWSSGEPKPAEARGGADGILDVAAPCIIGDTFVFVTKSAVGVVPVAAPVCATAEPIPVTLSPRADLHIRFEAPAGASLPRAGILRAFECGSWRSVLELPFAISESGEASIIVPAGCFDSRLTVGAFAPLGMPRLDLAPGSVRGLGTRKLIPGGTILARVESGEDHRPIDNVTVAAVRASAVATLRDPNRIAEIPPLAKGTSDARGWVQLAGLPGDDVVLLFGHPEARLPEMSDPYRVAAGTSAVATLVMERPAVLRVTVEAAAGLLVTSIEARPAPGSRWPRELRWREPMKSDGSARFDALPAGSWTVAATVRTTGSTSANTAEKSIELLPGTESSIKLEIGDRAYRGIVRMNGEPVPGLLMLKPGDPRTPGRSQTATIDSEGRFTVALDAPGSYRVSLQTGPMRHVALADPIAFRTPSEPVQIEVPSGRVTGIVFGPDDHPADETVGVIATRADGKEASAQATAGADGRFDLTGLDAGTWRVHASSKHGKSAAQSISMTDGGVRSDVVLRLAAQRIVHGRLLTADDVPVRDAMITAILPDRGDAWSGPAAGTNPAGEFELQVPAERSAPAVIMVRARGIAASYRTPLTDPLILRVPDALGIVHIRSRSGTFRRQEMEMHAIVAADGSYLHPLAAGRLQPGDREMVISGLPIGTWRYVVARNPMQTALLASGNGATLSSLATFIIQAGQNTDVVIEP